MTEEIARAADAPDFLVDREVGALLNTNDKALDAYRAQRSATRRNRELAARVDRIESSIDEIKTLLLKAFNQ